RADNPRKAELSRLLSETDAVHDVLAGGIYGLLTEMSRLDDEGADLLSLRDALMPQGLARTVQSTYRGQAGHAGLLRERLTADLRQQLAQIPLRKGNLLERTEAWLATADRLGALEEERARLELSEGPSFGT